MKHADDDTRTADEHDEEAALDRYRDRCADMHDDDLLDSLIRCTLTNSYGSHDAMARIVREEIAKRMAS